MNVIKYNVNSGDVCQIGRQYEYGKTQVIFEGYQVIDSANEIYFKFIGRTEDSKYLIPIVDMTLDITQQLTKHVGQFSCQLEEMNTEGTLVSQSPVFYVAVKRSIKVGADYEVQDPRLETIYQKYNEMYNIISQTNETSLANESQRQAEWITLKQEVADAVASADGKLDFYKASTTDTLQARLNGFIGEAEESIQTALETYETQTDSNINDKLTAYQSKTTSDINRMFDDSDRTSKQKIDALASELDQRRLAGEFNGENGKSAYQIAVDNGFIGTEAEWLASLRGADGKDGLQPDWNQNDETAQDYVKNRPFWREKTKELMLPGITEPIEVTTEDTEYGFAMARGTFVVDSEVTNYVVFDSVEYTCEPYYSEDAGGIAIGSFDFSDYPFLISNGVIITPTAGTHTVLQYHDAYTMHINYLPHLVIYTSKAEDGISPYLAMGDVEKIKVAFENGVPITLYTSYGNRSFTMRVNDVTNSFIYASGFGSAYSDIISQAEFTFYVSDGSLESYSVSYSGSIVENGNTYPLMYIYNGRYKITVDDSGTLKATKVT